MLCQSLNTENKENFDFYVVDFQATPTLGLNACKTLKFIEKVDSVETKEKSLTKEKLLKEFGENFKGLGKFEGQYKIVLDPNAKPVVNPPRNVHQTLLPKLKSTLESLKKSWVIEQVEEATDWVNNLVIVEKQSGNLRLCLDPRDLNVYIKRQHYKIPTLNDVTAKLNRKTVFTILDEKDGYH